ncbi:MAG: cell division ATPase MinD [Candidatus Aenigmatarchaeota archaeon]
MRRIISIVSGKGGVGKTVFASNLGLALTELVGDVTPVTLVDCDMSTANLGLHLGYYEIATGLHDVIERKMDIEDAVHFHPSGLRFIPTSLDYERTIAFNPYTLKNRLRQLEGIIIIDSPPGLHEDVFSVLKASTEAIVVTQPETTAVTDALKTINYAHQMKKKVTGIVVNRMRDSYEISPKDIEEMCDVAVIGEIPDDKHLKRSVFEKTPVINYRPHSKSAIEIRRIAAYLTGKEYNPPKFLRLRRAFS